MTVIVQNEKTSPLKLLIRRGTELKSKIGILVKRNSDPFVNSQPSVRPSPQEAEKWATSFHSLIDSKYGQALFKAFLRKEFCDENLDFWLAVNEYKKTRENKLSSKSQVIFENFIAPQAPREVNLDSVTKRTIESQLDQPTLVTFDQAQKRIQGILESDAYARFLKSDYYLELVYPERYQQVGRN